ncbi:tripartite motif-containing protein 59-like [Babylonia areolata]|uniref:tripartite motif-containing protein 59-like n=1 Tax=Babylonia areolata TaxID=304850 RepID=UPI003FD61428
MTTGESCGSLTSDKRESLTCALCLDIFKEPKLLSCSHTFCQKCLEDLIQQSSQETFPCPACRKDIEVPAQGASAFQTNFYISQDGLDRARDDTICSVHLRRRLDMFCLECDNLIFSRTQREMLKSS